MINVTSGHTQQAVELLGRLQSLASFPALVRGRGKESLVHTVCTCTKFPWYPAYYYFLETDHCIPKVRGRKHKAWLQVCNWGSMAVSLLKHLIQFERRLEIIVRLAVISSRRWSLSSCLISDWTSLLMSLYQWLSCSLRDLPAILKACLFTWSTSGNIYRSPADKANVMLLHL